MDDSGKPLFQKIAAIVEDAIADGSLQPGERAPSTNELAAFHSINPATARKGLAQLVEDNILEKRRGMGMFVSPTARATIINRRREDFVRLFVTPLLDEARLLGLSTQDVKNAIDSASFTDNKDDKQ